MERFWLPLLLGLPALGALLVLVTPRGVDSRWVRWLGVVFGTATLPVAVLAAYRGADVSWRWAEGLDMNFALRTDGLSGPLIVLTAALSWLCLLHLLRVVPAAGRTRGLVGLVLLIEVGLLGTFLASDLLLFFIFFETALVPMWFLVAVWGSDLTLTDATSNNSTGAPRTTTARQAATTFVLYTLLGSSLMLVGFLWIHAHTGTYDMTALVGGAGMSHSQQLIAFALIGTGFVIKVPMWPLHSWLPAAHTAAPTVGSVLLAGVMLKTGTYGLLRIAVPLLPEGALTFAPYLAAFGVAGIIAGSLACLRQTDLKRMIAYGSVGHMGFVLLGIASLTPAGLTGAMMAAIAHGIITGLLFFLVGAIKDRYHTAALSELPRGLYATMPLLGVALGFTALASLGLPGLAGFWGELGTLLAAYQPHSELNITLYRVLLGFALLGMVLTAAYLLRLIRLVLHGPPTEEAPEAAVFRHDLSGHEALVFTPLVLATLVVGVFPQAVLWIATPVGQQIARVVGGGQ